MQEPEELSDELRPGQTTGTARNIGHESLSGKWVARRGSEIVACADTLDEILEVKGKVDSIWRVPTHSTLRLAEVA